MIEAGLQQRLAADSAVAAIVGTQIYPMTWPDAPSFPLVTYQLISTVTTTLFSGPLSLCTVRIQYDTWCTTYGEGKTLAAAINASLEGFRGTLPNGIAVDNIVLDSSLDLYDSPSLLYRVSSDYLVTFTRS